MDEGFIKVLGQRLAEKFKIARAECRWIAAMSLDQTSLLPASFMEQLQLSADQSGLRVIPAEIIKLRYCSIPSPVNYNLQYYTTSCGSDPLHANLYSAKILVIKV